MEGAWDKASLNCCSENANLPLNSFSMYSMICCYLWPLGPWPISSIKSLHLCAFQFRLDNYVLLVNSHNMPDTALGPEYMEHSKMWSSLYRGLWSGRGDARKEEQSGQGSALQRHGRKHAAAQAWGVYSGMSVSSRTGSTLSQRKRGSRWREEGCLGQIKQCGVAFAAHHHFHILCL